MAYYSKPSLWDYISRYRKPPPQTFLAHHGVKGQKWGVRNGPPYPLSDKQKGAVEKTSKPGIIKVTVSGHGTIPKQMTPNSVVDHVSHKGSIDVRTFYGEDGMKKLEIDTTDHDLPKYHPWGSHAHDYEWNEDGTPRNRTTRPLTDQERKENDDIL